LDPQATGLPIQFTGCNADGQPAEQGRPAGGQFIANG
jgi:hypothetical protein